MRKLLDVEKVMKCGDEGKSVMADAPVKEYRYKIGGCGGEDKKTDVL